MPVIRAATGADAEALLAIYRPYVEGTSVSFEIEAPGVDEFRARIERSLDGWAWLVSELDGECVGYAYATAYRSRPAYRWSAETSAYVREDCHRRGIARALYLALFDVLADAGYCNAYAAITLPNPASVAFHERLGFSAIGVFRHVGWKFGAWHDVGWYQRELRAGPPPAGPGS